MSKTIPYIKLDFDWRDDPKVRLLKAKHGRKGEFAWVQMMIAMARCSGCVQLKNPKHMEVAKHCFGTSEEKVLVYCDWFAECGLIDPDLYARYACASSARAAREQRAREGRSEYNQRMRARGMACGKPNTSQSQASTKGGKGSGKRSMEELIFHALAEGQS